MTKKIIKFGDYRNKSDEQLVKLEKRIFNTIDTFLLKEYNKAKIEKKIEIRGVQHAINELCELQRELTLREK